jgi:hypothetical protein
MKYAGLIGIGIGLLLAASCCTSPPAPTATPTPTPSPGEVASRAGAQMLSTQSLHFLMELAGKLVFLDRPPTMALKSAEGDVVRPDRVRAIVKISSFGLISELGIIGIGDDQYLTNPVNQQWEKLPPGVGWYFDPAMIFDPDDGIEAILTGAQWSFGLEEPIGGQPHYHLQGRLPGERIAPLASGMIGAGQVEVHIWIGQEDDYVRRVRIVELESDPENPIQWLLEFSAFDEVEVIQPPPVP